MANGAVIVFCTTLEPGKRMKIVVQCRGIHDSEVPKVGGGTCKEVWGHLKTPSALYSKFLSASEVFQDCANLSTNQM